MNLSYPVERDFLILTQHLALVLRLDCEYLHLKADCNMKRFFILAKPLISDCPFPAVTAVHVLEQRDCSPCS